jgi:exosome complex component MTR3
MTRIDGRVPEEIRRIFVQTGIISGAAGSAYVEFGNTKVMVGVHGPRQADRRIAYSEEGTVHCDFKYAAFATEERGRAERPVGSRFSITEGTCNKNSYG